jgi:hypothetical protein
MSTSANRKIPKAAIPIQSQTPDYRDLRKQINDFESTFYGPHACGSCGAMIVKMATEQGGHAFSVPEENEISGKYKPHVCEGSVPMKGSDPLRGYAHFDSINHSVRHLAGKILTIVDAAVSDREQRKATKDLVRDAITQSLSQVSSACYKLDNPGCDSAGPEMAPLQPL